MKSYSRLVRTEQKNNIRKIYRYIILTVVVLIAFFFLGIPAIVKLISITTDITSSSNPIDKSDNTPPIKPVIEQNIEYTNKKDFLIVGQTEPAAVVKISVNGENAEIVANTQGEFNYSATLKEGQNIIYAIAIDNSGNESLKSDTFILNFDNTPPEIKLISPQNNQEFYGTGQKRAEFKGSTEIDAQIVINNRFVNVSDTGEFTHSFSLSDGDNEVIIKAKDKAGNDNELKINLKYFP